MARIIRKHDLDCGVGKIPDGGYVQMVCNICGDRLDRLVSVRPCGDVLRCVSCAAGLYVNVDMCVEDK